MSSLADLAASVHAQMQATRPAWTPPPECAACHSTGVLEWEEAPQERHPKTFCACIRGQWRAERFKQEERERQEAYQHWMDWRWRGIKKRLGLGDEADSLGVKLCDYSFETYRAYLRALGLPDNPAYLTKIEAFVNGWDRHQWLLLHGLTGNGKTGLMLAAVNALVKRGIAEGWDVAGTRPYGSQVWYAHFLTSINFIHRLQDGFRATAPNERTAEVRAEMEQTGLLALDDFGRGSTTEWVMQEYFGLINARCQSNRPMFLTTNLPLRELRVFCGDVLFGRILKNTRVVHVDGEDTRVLQAMLHNPDLTLADLGLEEPEVPPGQEDQPPKRHLRAL
jgi:DNA replication protein DnaC